MALNMNSLPPNAPVQIIEQFLKMQEESRGESKQGSKNTEHKQKLEQELIRWLENPANQPYLQIGAHFMSVEIVNKGNGLSKEIIETVYTIFHKNGMHKNKSIEEASIAFTDELYQAVKRLGTPMKTLKIGKTRPRAATIHALSQLGQM